MISKFNCTRLFLMMIVLWICNINSSKAQHGDISDLVKYPQFPNYVTLKELSNIVESNKDRQVYNINLYGWKPTREIVDRKLYLKNGSTYKYTCDIGKNSVRFVHPKESYSDPFVSCLPRRGGDITLTVTPTYLKLNIVEQIQADCEFGGPNNDPIRPKDVMQTDLACSPGSNKAQMEGLNGRLICPFTTSCTHSIYQTPRKTGRKARSRSGKSLTIGTPGGNEGDPYAPWRLKHVQTITINLASMAKANNMTKQELAWELIRGGFKFIPSSTNGDKFRVFHPEEEMRILLAYFFWKIFNLESYLTKCSKEYETKAVKLWEEGDWSQAADYIVKSYNIYPTTEKSDMFYNIKYEQLKLDLEKEGFSISKVMNYINTYNYKDNKNLEKASEIISSYIESRKDSVIANIVDNISINSCYSDIISAIAISDNNKERLDCLNSKENEYFKMRDDKAIEMMASFTKKTPIEFIDSAVWYAYKQSTKTLILEKQKQFKNNYKLKKGQYVKVKGVWYEINQDTNEASVSISRGKEYKGNINIQEEIVVKSKTYRVTRINDKAFAHSTKIENVTLPASIKEIGDKAFFNCRYLSSIKIPNSVTYIGNECFAYCVNLSNLILSNRLKNIPSGCFYNCNLENVNIPSTITHIGNLAFANNEKLTSMSLSNNIQYIGVNALNTNGETICLIFNNGTVPDIPMTFFAPFDKLSVKLVTYANKELWKNHNTWCKYFQ